MVYWEKLQKYILRDHTDSKWDFVIINYTVIFSYDNIVEKYSCHITNVWSDIISIYNDPTTQKVNRRGIWQRY